jgi:ribosome-binding protein aMBF1 (putative translation factor)
MATRTDKKKQLGLKIKLARIGKGIKQMDLADRLNINKSRFSLIENGWTMPTEDELRKIERALGKLEVEAA